MKLLSILAAGLLFAVAAPSFCWTTPAPVVMTSKDSLDSRVTVDANGKAHVVWREQWGGSSWKIMYSTNESGVFSYPFQASTTSSTHSYSPSICANGTDVHLVWASDTTGSNNFEAWYRKKSGAFWGPTYNASNTLIKSLRPQVAARGAVGPVVTCDEAIYADDNYDVFFADWNGGSFNSVTNLSETPGGAVYGSVNSNVVVAPNGDITVVWVDRISGQYHVNARRRIAGVWQARQEISTLENGPSTPGLAVGPDGSVHVIYSASDEIWYQKYSGSGWTSPVAMPALSRVLRPDIAVDDAGVAHVIADNSHDGVGDVYYTNNASGVWSNWANISNTPGTNSITAHIAYNKGMLYVVWMDNSDMAGGKGVYNIWYSSQSVYVGPMGTLSGVVKDQNGSAVVGATVSAGAYATTSISGGAYAMTLPVGTYTASASKTAYTGQTVNSVNVTQNGTTTVNFAINGDTAPPGQPAFSATANNGFVKLRWLNPSDSDFKGTMIRFRTDTYPTGPTDGSVACDKTNTHDSIDQANHTGLTNSVTYYYCAFAYDTLGNYSLGKQAVATPTTAPRANLLSNAGLDTYSNGSATAWTAYRTNDAGSILGFQPDSSVYITSPAQSIINLDSASLPTSGYTAAGLMQSVPATPGKVYMLRGFQDIRVTDSKNDGHRYLYNFGIDPNGGTSPGTQNGDGTIGGAKWFPSDISFWSDSKGNSLTYGWLKAATAWEAKSSSISVWTGFTINNAAPRVSATTTWDLDQMYLYEFDFPANATGTLWNAGFEDAASLQDAVDLVNDGDTFPDNWAPTGGSLGNVQTSECDVWGLRTGTRGARIFNRRGAIAQGLMQRLSTSPGTPISFNIWAKVDNNSTDTSVGIAIDPTGGTDVHASYLQWVQTTNKSWTQLATTSTAQAATATVFLRVKSTNPNTYDVYHVGEFDDASATWTPGSGQIAGVVRDNAGSPMSGATVTITPGNYVITTATDGSYASPYLTPGTYGVTGSHTDYQTQTVDSVVVVPGQTASADFALVPAEKSVQDCKSLALNTPVSISDALVTAGFDNLFYIEGTDRFNGIGITWAGPVNAKDMVAVSGKIAEVSGEIQILATRVDPISSGNTIPAPLGISIKALGGNAFGLQKAVKDAYGLSNIGLLIRTSGKVVDRGAGYIMVDDGSIIGGVKVYTSYDPGTAAPYVTVTGISSCEIPAGESVPVRVIRATDVRAVN